MQPECLKECGSRLNPCETCALLSPDEPDTPVVVYIEKDQLRMKSLETGDWALSPISQTEFVYMDGGVELTFIKGDDDRVDQVQRWGAVLSRKK